MINKLLYKLNEIQTENKNFFESKNKKITYSKSKSKNSSPYSHITF